MPHTLKQCWRQGVCRCALLCGACAASEIAPRRAPGAAGRVVADLARALRPDQSRRELWHRVSTGALLMGWAWPGKEFRTVLTGMQRAA